MLWLNWPVADTIHPLSNNFARGVKLKATCELELNDSLDDVIKIMAFTSQHIFDPLS